MDSNIEQLMQDLTCPITMELFEDPISVPCCGKTFSRLPLFQYLETQHTDNKKCPLCNSSLADFNPMNVAKNTTVAGMIDTLVILTKKTDEASYVEGKLEQIWSAVLSPVYDRDGKVLPVAELKLSLEKSMFQTKPSLFIAVVDNSGSMGGNPWNQVRTALTHITAMSRINPSIKTVIITYNSTASVVPINVNSEMDTHRVINSLSAGGGTNFSAAFEKVREVLIQNRNQDFGSVNITFLTDGQDNASPNKSTLATDFKEMLTETWTNCALISVHSVGFSGYCDMGLLEALYNSGTVSGTMRYAEPSDPDDLLCSKLQSLFDLAAKSSTVQLQIEFHLGDDIGSVIPVQFPVDKNSRGSMTFWIKSSQGFDQGFEGSIIVNSELDTDVVVPVKTSSIKKEGLLNRWFASEVDGIAAELLNITKHKDSLTPNILQLHCSIIQQKLDAIQSTTDDDCLTERVTYLLGQVVGFKNGLAVNIGKLNDLMFASKFGNILTTTNKPKQQQIHTRVQPILQIKEEKEWKENYVKYSRNSVGKQRNAIQEAIVNNPFNRTTPEILAELEKSTMDDMVYKDVNGNTVLHLVAYCGQSITLEKVLEKYPDLDMNTINAINSDGETPMTLAIKKQGYWRTINILLTHDALIPSDRKKALEQYVLNKQLTTTAEIISNYGDPSVDVNMGMTPDYVRFQYSKATTKEVEFDVQTYLDVSLAKQMKDMVKLLIEKHGAVPTIQMLLDHCIPPKPDDPETPVYIGLAKLVLKYNKDLIHEFDNNGDTPLMVATVKGSLPHVKLFIQRAGLDSVDRTNMLGNTALWLACMKGYPCIVTELLNCGADPNKVNLKGNPPLYSVCQRGPKKIVETLVASGATVDHINGNGDTLILICCRNGQHDILEFLLNYVDSDFVDFKAHIDGFNAILASTEANRPECIRVLHEYGVDLNQKTDDDNPILAGATPLHLAAYYEREKALKALLSLGANTDQVDINSQTPLHIAVIQGNTDIIKLLRHSGCSLVAKDSWGNTPVAYCRNRDEVRRVLTDPALDSLMALAKGQFTKEEEEVAFKLLRDSTGGIGCLTKKDSIDVSTFDSSTPLLQAIIHSNYPVVKVLLELGADPTVSNTHGLDSRVWAHLAKNPRIMKEICTTTDDALHVAPFVDRVIATTKQSPQNASIMFLSNRPKILINLTSSGIDQRMEVGINTILENTDLSVPDILVEHNVATSSNGTSPSNYLQMIDTTTITKCISSEDTAKEEFSQNIMWNAKIFTINTVASSPVPVVPQHVLGVALYTNNHLLFNSVNAVLQSDDGATTCGYQLKPFVQTLYRGLMDIDPFVGEVFIGANRVNRHMFKLGNTVCSPTFLSSSTMWRVAVEHVKDYAGSVKKKVGTIFIIKSKTGRHVGCYSQFSFDSEVIFLPNTKFVVTRWYRGGDFIVLGQENIREHTYGVKEEEMYTLLNNNRSVVIELQEI